MLDEIMDIFINRIKKTVVTDEKMTDIPLAYLMTMDIPQSIKHFFDQEVEIWIREEQNKFTTNERFDYDMPEVRMLIDQLFDYLKQNARFHITKFNQLLERAVKLEMKYLIEPHRTLSQFLFKNSPRISTIEIYDTLKYFFRYEYYKNAISEYFDLKYLKEISQDQFEQLLDQIDDKAFAEQRIEKTLGVIKTIMTFLSEAQQKDINSLSVDILQSSFRDRKLNDFIILLEEMKREIDVREMTFDEVETLLRGGSLPGMESKAEVTVSEKIGFEKVTDIESSKPTVSVDQIEVQESTIVEEEPEETEEIEEELEEEEEEAAAKSKVAEEPVPVPVEETKRTSVADDLAAHVARQISSERPLGDLNQMITGRTRRKVIKKLFNKKENEFLGFIEAISEYVTWKDASRFIDDEFYNRGINPYSSEAISLSDIIYVRYFPKDKYVNVAETEQF